MEMTENSNDPLTPAELFRRGIGITQEIRGRIIETRAYYLGRSSHEPAQPLSEIFDPIRGPILKYFIATIRTINRTQFIERFCRTAAFHEFQRSSEATLEELRLLAIQLAMCLDVPDKTDRRRSVGQALKTSVYFFRIANGRFFRQLPWSGSLVHLLLRNRNNEGFGIYIADRLLNDIAKAFEVRERQLRGESAAVEHIQPTPGRATDEPTDQPSPNRRNETRGPTCCLNFVTTVREKWSTSLLTRGGTGSVNRGHLTAGEEVAVDAPKMDRLGGLLRCGFRELHLALHCQSSRERRSSSCCM